MKLVGRALYWAMHEFFKCSEYPIHYLGHCIENIHLISIYFNQASGSFVYYRNSDLLMNVVRRGDGKAVETMLQRLGRVLAF